MVGVILAAGNGTRFGDPDCSKVLNRISNTFLIEFALNNLNEFGIKKACIVVGSHGKSIIRTLGDEYKGIRIQYAYQAKPIGLINALVQAIELIPDKEDICLQLADEVFVGLRTESIKTVFTEMRSDFYCGVTIEDAPERIKQNYSVEIDGELRVTKCTEKPAVVTNCIKGTGLCFFRFEILQLLMQMYDPKLNTPCDLCDFVNALLAEGRNGTALCVAEREFNINTPADLDEAAAFLLQSSLFQEE